MGKKKSKAQAGQEATKAQLRHWYQHVLPLRLELVGDFAGKELFVIHGDSLLNHCITEANVDIMTGFQILHAIHAVESLLAQLKERGCNFHVVFFSDHENLCIPEDVGEDAAVQCLRLTRKIIINHLQHFAESVPEPGLGSAVFEFDDARCDEFKKYPSDNAVHFFLSLDGRGSRSNSFALGFYFLEFIHNMAFLGYSIALLDGIEFASSKVFVSAFSPSSLGNEIELPEFGPFELASIETLSELELAAAVDTQAWSPWADGAALSLKYKISLTGLCNVLLEDSSSNSKACTVAYLLHLSVLRRCDLSQRSCAAVSLSDSDEEDLDEFLDSFAQFCITAMDDMATEDKWDVCDILDGRILRRIYKNVESLQPGLGIMAEVKSFANRILQLTRVDIFDQLPQVAGLGSDKKVAIISSTRGAGLLPFSHPVIDKFLESMSLTTKEPALEGEKPKIYQELTHWHNAKRFLEPIRDARRPVGHFALRRAQRWMKEMMAYSASLTGASGKVISPEIIVIRSQGHGNAAKGDKMTRLIQAEPPKQKNQARGGKHKSVKGGRERALAEAERVKALKTDKKSDAVLAAWHEQCREFQAEKNPLRRYLKADKYLSKLSKENIAIVGVEASVFICSILASLIDYEKLDGNKAKELGVFALMWSKTIELSQNELPPNILALLKSLFKVFSLPLSSLPAEVSSNVNRTLPFRGALERFKSLEVTLPPSEFQLRYCGPYLERSFDSASDERVPNFRPDAWQRRVLDAIDARKSLFVVAPTSAGKTFISFYAMKQVLQASDDGVLVYVAPTKALPDGVSGSRDGARYSSNLTPGAIGQAEDGVVWEQILLLAPCPIIALSATIGNPVELKSWLETIEKSKGVELEMIVHKARYSDLRKFIYTPAFGSYRFQGLADTNNLHLPGLDEGEQGASPFTCIHPIACLVNRNRGTLEDLTLEPRDCLSLWHSMSKHKTAKYPVEKNLAPETFFKGIIKKPDVVKWEQALKRVLESWMKDSQSPFSAVQKDLGSSSLLSQESQELSALTAGHSLDAPLSFGTEFVVQKDVLETTALPLLMDLRSRGALPAILFDYDRNNCEATALFVQKQLEQAETAWKGFSREWQRKVAKYEQWKRTASTRRKAPDRSTDNQELSKLEMIRQLASAEASQWESFDPNAPLEQFSFANHTKLLPSELDDLVYRLRYANLGRRIIDALRRGIAVHHAGMNRGYRQVVEMLFCKGFLTAVIATGTLALGLNMPCKTVVFFGDSIFLTALNYLQAAGRAGRRGFDILGNVVFAGMKPARMFEIMSSRLPDLRGHFALSTSLVLRTMSLLHQTENSEYAVRAVRSLMSQTRLYIGGPSNQMGILHHLRFSIEYLRRQHLLSSDGAPLNFSGLVGHLYFTENSVFAFHALLKEGYFNKATAAIHNDPDGVLLELMLVLSHLFCRIPMRRATMKFVADSARRSPSIISLPPMPEDAVDVLRAHNDETLKSCETYVATFIDQHLESNPDTRLPLSKVEVVPEQRDKEWSSVIETLEPTKVRSPFAALSGFTDNFDSIHELCSTVRSGVFLEESTIPYIGIFPDDTKGIPWNTYLYDFFKHGDLTALVRDNGIKRGGVWDLLKSFSLILATIVTSLTNFLSANAAMDDSMMMDVQGAADIMEETHDAQQGSEAAATEKGKGPDPSVSRDNKGKKTGKTKMVVDSWDAETSDEDEPFPKKEPDVMDSDSEQSTGPSANLTEASWQTDGGSSLVRVLTAFRKLQEEFDDKFRKVWS